MKRDMCREPNSRPHYLQVIEGELTRRCSINPRYSLRSFAKSMEVSPGALSNVLTGKRKMGLKMATTIVSRLGLSPIETTRFFGSYFADKQPTDGLKAEYREKMNLNDPEGSIQVENDKFEIISEWYHLAILQLSRLKFCKSDFSWIANQLGIPEIQVSLGVKKLMSLKLLTRKGKKMERVPRQLDIGNPADTHKALRHYQKQVLKKAIFSIDNDPIEERCISTVSLAINPKKLPYARELTREFLKNLDKALSEGELEKVYHINVNMYPVSKGNRHES